MKKRRIRLNNQANFALRISHMVYGRQTKGRKVTYLIDPRGIKERRAIPETVVLTRWRMRGASFSGTRLSSTLWRALPVVLGADPSRWHMLDTATIETSLSKHRKALRENRLAAPAAIAIRALLDVCPWSGVRNFVQRHAELGPEGRSGVPDLFLYCWDHAGRATMPRFVEVKKPGEAVSEDQKAEIALLNRYGLPARILRLIERESRPALTSRK